MVVLSVLIAGCRGDDDGLPSSTIPVPSVAGPATAAGGATTAPAAAPPCDLPLFVDLMRSQGPKFELSPATLAALTPIGEPSCARGYADLSFSGPPEDPGPFGALFAVKDDRSGWDLFAVDCLTSVDAGRRQVC